MSLPANDGAERLRVSPQPLRSFSLHDAQALFGGRVLWAARESVFHQLVAPGAVAGRACLAEKRYRARLTVAQWTEVERLAAAHRFFTLSPSQRLGLPDEGRPRITLTAESGEVATVQIWASDHHPDFDPLYHYLRALWPAEGSVLVYEGAYDWEWRPDEMSPAH